MFVMKMLEVTSDLKRGDSWQGREIFNTNICTLRRFERLLSCFRRKLGPCPIPSIDQYGVHHISSQHEIQFFHLQPRLDQQLARWEIINEEWKMPETSMLPITRIIHVTTSFMGLKWPTHWGTWTPLCLMRPVRRCLYFCRPTVLLLPSLPALWPCPCSFTAGRPGWLHTIWIGSSSPLLVFTFSGQNKTSISGVWNMTGCTRWMISGQLEWWGVSVLDKQKYLQYLIIRL